MNKKKMKPLVGLSYNLKNHACNSDEEEEFDEIETIDFLRKQLESFNFEVILLEQDNNLFDKLIKFKPCFVMNIAEGRGKTRNRESQVPCMLDWLKIPHYGSDAVSLGLTLDKHLTNTILKNCNIPTPEMVILQKGENINKLKPIFTGKNFIVKPRWEGSSKGIFNHSVTNDIKNCKQIAEHIINTYNQPAVIEEFIEGAEITTAVIGNENLKVFGMMHIKEKKPSKLFIYSIENKRDWKKKIKYELAKDSFDTNTLNKIKDCAFAAFKALELKDIARIDFRLKNNKEPMIIDINPLPGLSPKYSDIMLLSKLLKKDYETVVRNIIFISLKRNNIKRPQ